MSEIKVKVGSARIDENGKAHGGKAGDQTGKEVSTQNWYKHNKGWRVFRAKNAEVAEKIAWDMQAACNNSNIGYDQYERGSLYKMAKVDGFNCAKVKTKCETDCSALVRVCCAYAGVMLPDIRTPSEPKALLDSGAFVEMTGTKYTDSSDYLRRGDILVTKTQGHTVVVLSSGKYADEVDNNNAPEVEVTGGTVYVREAPNKYSGKIMGVVRLGERYPYQGVTSEEGWNLIIYKNKNGWISGKYSKIV